MSDLELEFLLYGYSDGIKPLTIDDNIKIVMKDFNSRNFKVESEPRKISLTGNEILEITKNFLNVRFNFHDVLHVSESDVDDFIELCNEDLSVEEMSELLDSKAVLISPYDLPVTFIDDLIDVGYLETVNLSVDNASFMKSQKAKFSGIMLGIPTIYTSALYGHELVHSQLMSVEGAVKNYHNIEVLSMFIDNILLYDQYGEQFFDEYNELALSNLYQHYLTFGNPDSDEEALLESSICVSSTFKALHLLDKYKKMNEEQINEMFSEIQKVFDGQSTTEEFLDKEKITLENSVENFSKVYIKKETTF